MSTKIKKLVLKDFRPDDMDVVGLKAWVNHIGQSNNPAVANTWFPGQKDRFRYARLMRGYCENRLKSIAAQATFTPDDAIDFECNCSKIRRDLPKEVQW